MNGDIPECEDCGGEGQIQLEPQHPMIICPTCEGSKQSDLFKRYIDHE